MGPENAIRVIQLHIISTWTQSKQGKCPISGTCYNVRVAPGTSDSKYTVVIYIMRITNAQIGNFPDSDGCRSIIGSIAAYILYIVRSQGSLVGFHAYQELKAGCAAILIGHV